MFDGTTRPIEITERRTAIFWSKVTKPDGEQGCWEWRGPQHGDGYGHLGAGSIRAHRYAYTLLVGPIPPRLVIDHLCRVRHCVNPLHLEVVTSGENVLRGIGGPAQNKRRTQCKRGHVYVKGSYYIRPSRPTERLCKACNEITRRERMARRTGLAA